MPFTISAKTNLLIKINVNKTVTSITPPFFRLLHL